jgi:hypothetical protein
VPVSPPEHLPAPIKRARNRHYLQQYFTKRAWNIAQHLIAAFTQGGDWVLDPFCGAGVVPVEALVLRRRALACDINPWAVFITRMAVLAPVDLGHVKALFEEVIGRVRARLELVRSDPALSRSIVASGDYPRDPLPPGIFQRGLLSLDQLFSPRQIAELVVLRDAVNSVSDRTARDLLRLALSITLDRANLMYSARNKSTPWRGQSAPFSVRRYRVWDDPTDLPADELFARAFEKILTAKADANKVLGDYVCEDTCRIWQGSATDLGQHILPDSVDYVLTDPPYGRNYNYLDLSMMWNAWLGFHVSDDDYANEVIQGGSRRRTREQYRNLLEGSLEQIARALKPGRWATLIYAESNMETWSWLLGACKDNGLRFVDTVWSDSALPTHKKRQSPYASAAGEYYVSFRRMSEDEFRRVYPPPVRLMSEDPVDIVRLALGRVIVAYLGASIELISDAVISKQLLGEDLLTARHIGRTDVRDILTAHFDPNGGRWQLRDLSTTDTGIDPYELLRYGLFHALSRAPETGLSTEALLRSLARLMSGRAGDLPLHRVRGILRSFASPCGASNWRVDQEKVGKFAQLRLFFENATVDGIRETLRPPAERAQHCRKNIEGIADLTSRLVRKHPRQEWDAVRLALLTEHVAAAVVTQMSVPVRAVAALDDLATGRVDLNALRNCPLNMMIVADSAQGTRDRESFILSERVLGPVLSEHQVWFNPFIVSPSDAAAYQGPRLDIMVL